MTIKRTIRIVSVLMATAALAACSSHEKSKEVNIVPETATHAVAFDDGKIQLSQREYDSLAVFMQSVKASAVSYAGITADDTDSRSVQRAQRIKAYLVKQGVEPQAIHLQPVSDNENETVMLTLEYAKALSPKHCPDWSESAVYGYSNPMTFSNFGCAYDNNIAQQMVNPADYEGAHGAQVIDAGRDSVGIQKYRTAAPAPLASVSASAPASSSAAPASSSGSVSSTGAIGSQ